jgi:hypothetical protein
MRDKFDKILGRIMAVAMVIVVLMLGYSFVKVNAGAFTRLSDIQVDQPERAVRDARDLIEKKRHEPTAFGPFSESDDLPSPLRIPNLRYAKVHVDHVDLVVARNPDISIGARIWAVQHQPHRDTATRYKDIWFFRYSNDAPASSENIP